MKKITLLLAGIVLLFATCQKDLNTNELQQGELVSQSASLNGILPEEVKAEKYVPNQIIVKFRNGIPDKALLKQQNSVVKERIFTATMARANYTGIHVLMVPDVEKAITAFKRNPNVEWANPNWIVKHQAFAPTNDTYYNNLWGMTNIKVQTAWNAGNTGDQQVYVGVIDEGIMYWHEDLCGQIWTNPYETENGKDDDGNGYIDDMHGWDFMHMDNTIFDNADNHGTHVAGTIGGVGNNSKGVVGVSPNVTIISGKFLEGSGSTADAVKAIDYMTDLKVRHGMNIAATSNSWGGGGYDQALYDAINRAKVQDILFVAAAGNNGANTDVSPNYPSNYNIDNIISVAAYASNETLPSWTNYGATTVDIGAPGVSILSTLPGAQGASTYDYYSGTSMATPHVAGAVALYKAGNPTAKYTEVKNAILSSARPIAALSGKSVTGGVLNVETFIKPTTNQQTQRGCVIPPIDYIAPTNPTNFKEISRDSINGTATLSWTPATDNIAIARYYITIGYSWFTAGYNVSGNATTFVASGLIGGVKYPATITAYDAWNNKSSTINYTIDFGNDTVPPTTPKNFRIVGIKSTSVTFAYDWATDSYSGVGMYRISYKRVGTNYWSGWHTNEVNPLEVPSLTTGAQYEFTIAAMDNNKNWSPESSPALLATPGNELDLIAPSTPLGLNATKTTNSITPYWSASTDNVGVVGYDVFYKKSTDANFTLYTTTTNTLVNITGLSSATSYNIYVIAKDAAGNKSAASSTITVTTDAGPDVNSPTAPTNLTATSTTNSITPSWTASTDNVGVTGYNVYYKLSSASSYTLHTTTSNTTTTINGLNSNTSYDIYVNARDAAGNVSVNSNVLTRLTQSPANYTISISLAGTIQKKTQHKLTWTGSITPSGSTIKSVQLQWLSNNVWTTLYTSSFISDTYIYNVTNKTTRQYRVLVELNTGQTANSNTVSLTTR